jgi:hypothetical protein
MAPTKNVRLVSDKIPLVSLEPVACPGHNEPDGVHLTCPRTPAMRLVLFLAVVANSLDLLATASASIGSATVRVTRS